MIYECKICTNTLALVTETGRFRNVLDVPQTSTTDIRNGTSLEAFILRLEVFRAKMYSDSGAISESQDHP